MAAAYGIVRQHHGWIEAESEPGRGATFRVYLPVSVDRDAASRRTSKTTIQGGTETILVVEDEAPVRELVCKVLGGYGYKTIQAPNGAKALDAWKRSKGKVDLLLTGSVLSDSLNGRELGEKLRANHPKLKVIFSSEYCH